MHALHLALVRVEGDMCVWGEGLEGGLYGCARGMRCMAVWGSSGGACFYILSRSVSQFVYIAINIIVFCCFLFRLFSLCSLISSLST